MKNLTNKKINVVITPQENEKFSFRIEEIQPTTSGGSLVKTLYITPKSGDNQQEIKVGNINREFVSTEYIDTTLKNTNIELAEIVETIEIGPLLLPDFAEAPFQIGHTYAIVDMIEKETGFNIDPDISGWAEDLPKGYSKDGEWVGFLMWAPIYK